MRNTVTPRRAKRRVPKAAPRPLATGGLYTGQGARKYLTQGERRRVLAPLDGPLSDAELLALTLDCTGARISEALALTADSFQLDGNVIALRTLKRRQLVVRELPVPAALIAALETRFGLAAAQRAGDRARLWPCCRVTAWRWVKAAMTAAGIHGRQACPRGMRHGFAVGTLQSGVPLPLAQRWLGHARLETTAIYAQVSGAEERAFAEGFHRWSSAPCR